MKRITIIFFSLLVFSDTLFAQTTEYELHEDISYFESAEELNPYQEERCKVDIYLPKGIKNFPTVVWFHGGGLTGGEKHIPDGLKQKNIAVIAANYRLYPDVKAPVYIEDATAAVAWVFKNIESYGGDPKKIFVSGHSAGGYLASMIGMDKSYLAVHGIDADEIAGLIPFSGHTITHFTVRKERGIAGTQPIIDRYAPLYHVRADAPPLLLITGDRNKELLGRYEENAYMMRMMKEVGHTETRLLELDGYGHMMTHPAFPLLIEEVNRISTQKD